MNKKAILIKENDVVVDVIGISTFTDPADFIKKVEEAKQNKERIEHEKEVNKQMHEDALHNRLSRLESSLEQAHLEIDLLRGRITDEEYEERMQQLCGTK